MGGKEGLAAAEALLEIGRPAQARLHAAEYVAGHPADARGLRTLPVRPARDPAATPADPSWVAV